MDCTCAASSAEDFSSTLLSKKVVTARKPHKCGECRDTISPGEKYECYTGVSDGYFFTAKTCLDCLSLRKAFFCNGYIFEGMIEELEEHVRECGGDISESVIAGLTPGARETLCGMIEELWGD